MILKFVLLAIGAYLLGAVPAAYLAVKWTRGVDIRKLGTGKVGASNVLSAGPKWAVVPVALFDIGKGALVVWVAKLIGLNVWAQGAVGLAAIAGHNWPVYMGFKSGGRGVFVSLGVITMLSWPAGLFCLVCSYLFAPVHQVALGVFLSYVGLPFFGWFVTFTYTAEARLPVTISFIAIAVMGLGIRLIARRNKMSINAPWRAVLFYRLLFDRDIRDRKLWNTGSNGTTV